MNWQVGLFAFAVVVACLAGGARWFGAPRWLAFSIPTVPLAIWLVWCFLTGAVAAGQGGAIALWFIALPLFLIALPVSGITVFIVPKRHDKIIGLTIVLEATPGRRSVCVSGVLGPAPLIAVAR